MSDFQIYCKLQWDMRFTTAILIAVCVVFLFAESADAGRRHRRRSGSALDVVSSFKHPSTGGRVNTDVLSRDVSGLFFFFFFFCVLASSACAGRVRHRSVYAHFFFQRERGGIGRSHIADFFLLPETI